MIRVLAFAVFYSLLLVSTSGQAPDRMFRVGVISPSAISGPLIQQHTLPELERRGFKSGRNLEVEWRVGPLNDLGALARELVSTKPDVVVAVSDFAIRAVYDADPNIPIVMSFIGDDPVAAGFAESLSRPGGRVTGNMMLSHDLDAKRLELLKEVLPSAKRVAVLRYPPPRHDTTMAKLRMAAGRLGLTLQEVAVAAPSAYSAAIQSARHTGAEALLVASSPDFARDAATIARVATAAGLPSVCEWDHMAREGCLIGHGPSNAELRRRTGVHVAQILQGVPPGAIPIEGPTNFTMVLNLKTARSLGIGFQPAVLARADEVIE